MRGLPDSTPLLSDPDVLRARADEDGCLLLRGRPGPGAVAPLRELARAVAAELGLLRPGPAGSPLAYAPPGAALTGTGWDDPRWIELQRRVLPDPRFTAVGDDPTLLGALETIYGAPPATRHGDLCRLVLPGAPHLTTPPHQDHSYTGGPPDLWTAWIPLVPVPIELGPIAVRPGSHREGPLPHRPAGDQRAGVELPADAPFAAAALEPGDAVLFHGLTVHRALPNETADRVRLSAEFRYRSESKSKQRG